jgi:hypothetical protein
MTFWTLESDLPWIELPGETVITFEAIDPTTGSAVSGVSVSEVAIYGDALGGGIVETDVVPAWTPLEVEEQA